MRNALQPSLRSAQFLLLVLFLQSSTSTFVKICAENRIESGVCACVCVAGGFWLTASFPPALSWLPSSAASPYGNSVFVVLGLPSALHGAARRGREWWRGGGMFEEDYGFSWRSVNPLTKLVELYFLFSQSILKNSVSFAFWNTTQIYTQATHFTVGWREDSNAVLLYEGHSYFVQRSRGETAWNTHSTAAVDIQARGTATINTFSSWDSLHTGANQSRGSGHAEIPLLEDRALCLLGPPATQDDVLVEIPDIYLTFLGNLLAQALWWLSEVLVLSRYKHLSESGRLSQNVLHVGCRRPERLRENLYLVLILYLPERLLVHHRWAQWHGKHRSKDPTLSSCSFLSPAALFNSRMEESHHLFQWPFHSTGFDSLYLTTPLCQIVITGLSWSLVSLV